MIVQTFLYFHFSNSLIFAFSYHHPLSFTFSLCLSLYPSVSVSLSLSLSPTLSFFLSPSLSLSPTLSLSLSLSHFSLSYFSLPLFLCYILTQFNSLSFSLLSLWLSLSLSCFSPTEILPTSSLQKLLLDDLRNEEDQKELDAKDNATVLTENDSAIESDSAAIGLALVDSLYSYHKRLAEVFQYFDTNNRWVSEKVRRKGEWGRKGGGGGSERGRWIRLQSRRIEFFSEFKGSEGERRQPRINK